MQNAKCKMQNAKCKLRNQDRIIKTSNSVPRVLNSAFCILLSAFLVPSFIHPGSPPSTAPFRDIASRRTEADRAPRRAEILAGKTPRRGYDRDQRQRNPRIRRREQVSGRCPTTARAKVINPRNENVTAVTTASTTAHYTMFDEPTRLMTAER
jgi:hypothetical protein